MMCLFCKIISGDIKGDIIHEDDKCLAFADISPQAPTHLLVVPRKHIASLAEATDEDRDVLGHLLLVGAQLAKQKGIIERGYRTVINTNAEAGQTVFHIHVHILGGRQLGWPPG